MPNCFALYRKSDPTKTRVPFVQVDEELCKAFGQPVDPDKYLGGWYDSIGFRLALGWKLNEARFDEAFTPKVGEVGSEEDWGSGLRLILAYLREHFESDAWATIGR